MLRPEKLDPMLSSHTISFHVTVLVSLGMLSMVLVYLCGLLLYYEEAFLCVFAFYFSTNVGCLKALICYYGITCLEISDITF